MNKDEIKALKKAKKYRKNAKLLAHCWEFKDLEDFKAYIIKNKKFPDYVAIYDIPFTMEEYDMSGKQVFYANRLLDLSIEVNHPNRYEYMANINFIEISPACCYRRDIQYLQ